MESILLFSAIEASAIDVLHWDGGGFVNLHPPRLWHKMGAQLNAQKHKKA